MARPIHLLLVEDNPGDVRLTTEAVGAAGLACTVDVVGDGEQALDYLHHRPPYQQAARPDLVLLDLNLPCLSGYDVLADVKGDASLRSIPIVILSGSNAESDVERAYGLQANCYVTKPVGAAEFAKTLRAIEDFWFGVATLPGNAAHGG
jgi:CheY-like chemotaxis protein